jgi:hypothetical protein
MVAASHDMVSTLLNKVKSKLPDGQLLCPIETRIIWSQATTFFLQGIKS